MLVRASHMLTHTHIPFLVWPECPHVNRAGGGSCRPAVGSGVGEGSCLETQLGVGQEGFSAVSWLRPPSFLWGQLAQLGRVEVTCLEVSRASTCIFPPPPALHSATMPGTPPTFCAFSPLPFRLSVSVSLTPSVSPWVPGFCLSGPGSPRPGAGLCKCGISRVSSAGLPAWLTFNLIRGGASAEPLIKAGRQLGECQGGLGPTE